MCLQQLGTPRTFNIPSSSYTNGQGTFQAQVPFDKDQKFLAIMSDASGFASGGISSLLEVGASVSNTNCNTTDPGVCASCTDCITLHVQDADGCAGVDFFYELNTALQQCR